MSLNHTTASEELVGRGRKGTSTSAAREPEPKKGRKKAVSTPAQVESKNPSVKKPMSFTRLPMSGANDDVDFAAELQNLSGYALDDIGNGFRFKAIYGRNLRYVQDIDTWYYHENGSGWRPDNAMAMEAAKRIAQSMQREALDAVRAATPKGQDSPEYADAMAYKKHAAASANMPKLRAMLESAKSVHGFPARLSDFDSNPRLLACQNTIVVLGNDGVTTRNATRDDLCSLTTAVKYDPEAAGVYWDAFLEKFQPDPELRRWLQKLAGYSLKGSNPERKLVMSIGKTGTGKSTFCRIMSLVLGGYAEPMALTAFRGSFSERPRPDVKRVLDKRFAFAQEASSGWTLHAEQVKNMTGGQDLITVRDLYEKGGGVTRVPAFTPWIFSNEVPRIVGSDRALYARLTATVWDQQIGGREDPNFVEKHFDPREYGAEWNLQAVLRWLVEGYVMYAREGLEDPPTQVLLKIEEIKAGLSVEGEFLADVCEFGPPTEYWASSVELFGAYERWADLHGVSGRDRLNGISLGVHVGRQGYERSQRRVPGTKKRDWGRSGLRLREEWRLSVSRRADG